MRMDSDRPNLSAAPEAFGPAPKGLSRAKWGKLSAFLETLPAAAASRLFETLEAAARAAGADEAGAADAAILGALRARLLRGGARLPDRQPTARRAFFAPFEDFFTPARRGRKRRARIARPSLAPIWRVLTTDPAAADFARAAEALDAAFAGGADAAAIERLEASMFRAAAEGAARLIAHADADPAFRAGVSDRLAGGDVAPSAGPSALHDLAELGVLLPAVDRLRAAQKAFQRPVRGLTEEELFEARRHYAETRAKAPDVAPYILLLIAARMDAPWRGLRLYYHIDRVRDGALDGARADAAILLETLFEDIEQQARLLERDAESELDADDAGRRLAAFSEFAAGMIEEARREGDAVVANRIEASRDVAASALQRFSEQSLAAIRKTMPVRHAGGSSRLMGLRPDFDAPLDSSLQSRARAGAQFLRRGDALAKSLARPTAAGPFAREAGHEIRRYAQDLVLEIRAAEGAERQAARRRMEATLQLADGLVPAADIALLSDRAAAAAVSA